jgi:2,4-dienoyl-CoA reductase-like NADH-dependent reductase (Old Yellow Enzyme family)
VTADFPLLGSPVAIGEVRLANRFVLSPLHTMLADRHGQVTPAMIAYYTERALGGAGLIMTEYAFVDHHASRANVAQLAAADDACLPGLGQLADAIHEAGARAGLQLAHCGRQRFLAVAPIVAPSRVPWPDLEGAPVPEELSAEAAQEIVASFARAAIRAELAGFDLVELHAGHGYLVGQFLSPHTNRRTDLYGGALHDRQRFLLEIVRAMRAAVGPGFPLVVRLSGIEYLDDGITLAETVDTATKLERAGVAAIDISAGSHETMEHQVQPSYFEHGYNVEAAAAVKRSVQVPVSVVGSITSPELAERILREGAADLVRLGRPLLADPHLPRKALAGRSHEIRPCIRCNDCLDRGTVRKHHVVCAVNWSCGRELRLARSPGKVPGRVVVVGGGVAGLEAARVAADAGHPVILFEPHTIGGLLATLAGFGLKRDLGSYLAWLLARVEGRIEVRRETATPECVGSLDPALVVFAAGAGPAEPNAVPSTGGPGVLDLSTALAGPVVGHDIVVAGTDQFAAEAAVLLATGGRSVSLVHRGADPTAEVGVHTSRPLRRLLAERGVRVLGEMTGLRAVPGACIVTRASGLEERVPCDTVVTAARAARTPDPAWTDAGWRLECVGDCVAPRRIFDAVHGANIAVRRFTEGR